MDSASGTGLAAAPVESCAPEGEAGSWGAVEDTGMPSLGSDGMVEGVGASEGELEGEVVCVASLPSTATSTG